jgi:septal ring factor EnvC (AmiA/AmiB activator)
MRTLLALILLLPVCTFAQSKSELSEQIERQKVTIDSLKKVNANYDNIIENRDRSIKILKEDKVTFKADIAKMDDIIIGMQRTIYTLENQAEQGKNKLIQLSNQSFKFNVAAGKRIAIHQVIADYTSGITTDSLGNNDAREIHVFLKAINGEVLTDVTKKQLGPQLFSSQHPQNALNFPIIFEENSKLEVQIFEGPLSDLKPYGGKILLSYTEKDLN